MAALRTATALVGPVAYDALLLGAQPPSGRRGPTMLIRFNGLGGTDASLFARPVRSPCDVTAPPAHFEAQTREDAPHDGRGAFRSGGGTQAEVLAALDRAGIANGAVNDVAGLRRHPQLAARGRWMEVDSPVGPIPALLPPQNLQGAIPPAGRVPALGEHAREILEELAKEAE